MRAIVSSVVAVVLLSGTSLFAQFQGGVRGAVRDADGGVLPGVTVTLTNEGTGNARTAVSNAVGEYNFSALAPGVYGLMAELPSFASYNQTGLEIQVQTFLVIDMTLQVEGITEQVVVTGETPLIESANASISSAIDKAQLEVLPTPGRNVFIMAVTTPNIVHTGDPVFVRQQDQTNSSLLSLGGGPLRGNNYTLDGVTISDMRNRAVIIPNFEGVEEMKVQVNTYDSEMGRTGGGVFNTIHKSGTNNFAGSALYQSRPNFGRVKTFFQDEKAEDAPYDLYAGSFGGPIVKDKTFFWFSAEGYQNVDLRNDQVVLPTSAMANGDFSGAGRTLYNPFDIDAAGNRRPFPGNVIPPSLLDPAGLALANQLASLGCAGNCSATASLGNVAYQWSTNVNHSFTDSWNMAGTYMFYDSEEPANKYYTDLNGGTTPVFDTGSASLFRTVHVVALNSTHIPSDTSVLTLRYGYTYFDDSVSNPAFGASDAAALGFQGDFLNQVTLEQFPYIEIDGYGDGDQTHGSWTSNDIKWKSQEVSGTYSKFVGSHTLKYGGQWRQIGLDAFNFDYGFQFSFSPNFTQGPNPTAPDATSGDALANLLLGLPENTGSRATIPTPGEFFVNYYGGFVQDDWRVNDKLVFNMGVRLEHETGLNERNDQFMVGFSRDASFPIQVSAPAGLSGAPGFPLRGGPIYAGVDGNPTHQWDPPSIKLGPRFGFAYSANSDTVLRGGYAVFWAPYAIPGGTSQTNTGTTGFTAVTNYNGTLDGITPTSAGGGSPGSLSNPYPNGLNSPTGSSLGLLTNAGGSLTYNEQFRESPYIQKWSLEMQRDLGSNVALKVGYIGSRGSNLGIGGTNNATTNINQLDPSFIALGDSLNDQLPNPFFGRPEFGNVSEATTLARGQLLRPFPQFQDVLARHVSNGRSTYNALRLEVEKRFRGNWGARINYTYSQQKDNIYESNTLVEDEEGTVFQTAAGCSTGRCGSLDRDFVTSNINSPHWLNLNGLYRLPSVGDGAANTILGGWSASVSALLRAGFPVAIKQSTNPLSSFGFDHQRPNISGDPSVSGSTEDNFGSYLNPGAFSNSAGLLDGNSPRTNTDARTPALINWDVSFEKTTSIGGDANLSLRFEFINIFDGVNWRGPRSEFGLSNFGEIQGVRGFPRTMQFMAKVTF